MMSDILTDSKKLADLFEASHGNLQPAKEGFQLVNGRNDAHF